VFLWGLAQHGFAARALVPTEPLFRLWPCVAYVRCRPAARGELTYAGRATARREQAHGPSITPCSAVRTQELSLLAFECRRAGTPTPTRLRPHGHRRPYLPDKPSVLARVDSQCNAASVGFVMRSICKSECSFAATFFCCRCSYVLYVTKINLASILCKSLCSRPAAKNKYVEALLVSVKCTYVPDGAAQSIHANESIEYEKSSGTLLAVAKQAWRALSRSSDRRSDDGFSSADTILL
jgi:hypothetical protein